ncbi:MAG: LysM domain-containing protein [Phycisphaeraceae bacterium]|nr:LysM domain-containing protein [Phycisphaeraceae bacterium]
MARDTKVGMLVGLGIVLLIGIIVSDQLAISSHQDQTAQTLGPPPTLADNDEPAPADNVDETAPVRPVAADNGDDPSGTIPMPGEIGDDPVEITPTDQRRPAWRTPPEAFRVSTQTGDDSQTLVIGDIPDEDETTTIGSPAPARKVIHHVAEGETLWNIAADYYGDGRYWRDIKEANPDAVQANGSVRAGVRLVIPNRQAEAETPETSAPAAPRSPQPRQQTRPATITVAAGDTLSSLAREHLGNADRWNDLVDANPRKLADPDRLVVGMELKLPGRSAPAQDRTYVIEPGDTLIGIARKTTGDPDAWADILNANRDRISSPNALPTGVRLKIPGR